MENGFRCSLEAHLSTEQIRALREALLRSDRTLARETLELFEQAQQDLANHRYEPAVRKLERAETFVSKIYSAQLELTPNAHFSSEAYKQHIRTTLQDAKEKLAGYNQCVVIRTQWENHRSQMKHPPQVGAKLLRRISGVSPRLRTLVDTNHGLEKEKNECRFRLDYMVSTSRYPSEELHRFVANGTIQFVDQSEGPISRVTWTEFGTASSPTVAEERAAARIPSDQLEHFWQQLIRTLQEVGS